MLTAGDPAPWFYCSSTSSPRYSFSTAAGRYIVLCFFLSAGDESGAAALAALHAHRSQFDDVQVSCFGVSVDAADRDSARVQASLPGIRHFWDFDSAVSRLYGAIRDGQVEDRRQFWLILDPTLRVIRLFDFKAVGPSHDGVFSFIRSLPPIGPAAALGLQAPVLFVPNVFEAHLCKRLIESYERAGGTESGFMREVDGKTVGLMDPRHKRRKDHEIEEPTLLAVLRQRVRRRVVPEILKVHQFAVTRMERFTVGCYDAADGGHFRAHRDNTTAGTAHRRFAVSINLNAEFAGGELTFPEYGTRSYKPPPGSAIVFSCSLLHAVTPVTQGRRFAFLPFLYDEPAALVRAKNLEHLQVGPDASTQVP